MRDWQAFVDGPLPRSIYRDKIERQVRLNRWQRYRESVHSWDLQWSFTVHKNQGLVAIPASNLVRNIGWNREDATHTTGNSLRADKAVRSILPLTHPPAVEVDLVAQTEFVESRGLGVKKHRLSYKIRKNLGRLRRALGKALGR